MFMNKAMRCRTHRNEQRKVEGMKIDEKESERIWETGQVVKDQNTKLKGP